MSDFYNTIGLIGETLKQAREAGMKQKDIVLSAFEGNPNKFFSPSEIEKLTGFLGYNWPITSIRRAISDLTNEGKLIKSATANKTGSYGRPEYSWIFKS